MDYSWYKNTDLGENSVRLHELSQTYKNSIFVDLGVRAGASSGLLCDQSKQLNNKIYGIDIDNLIILMFYIPSRGIHEIFISIF